MDFRLNSGLLGCGQNWAAYTAVVERSVIVIHTVMLKERGRGYPDIHPDIFVVDKKSIIVYQTTTESRNNNHILRNVMRQGMLSRCAWARMFGTGQDPVASRTLKLLERKKVTTLDIGILKRKKKPITMVTAYDYPSYATTRIRSLVHNETISSWLFIVGSCFLRQLISINIYRDRDIGRFMWILPVLTFSLSVIRSAWLNW